MQWLAELSVRRAVLASVLMLALVVVGVVGYANLSVDAFPKIDFPVVVVTTTLQGAAPEEVETQITDKIEAAVNTISGIDELRSTSSEGVSQVFMTFSLDKDVNVAAQDVRDHVNASLSDLPRGIDAPSVQKLDPDAAPILYLAVASQRPIVETTELVDKHIRRDIENVSGVGQVRVVGGRKRQINIWMDPQRLKSFGVSAGELSDVVAKQNLSAPGGSIETGPENITMRVKGRVPSPQALGRIVIRNTQGRPVRIEDVATVEDGQEQEVTAASLNETPTLILSIRKQSGENTVAVVDRIRERLEDIRPQLPSGTTIDVVRDASGTIRTQVDAVKEHLVLGAIFAAIVVLVFLGNLRATVIAAFAIPISIIGTFALMWMKGFSLNIITLLALALAVGIVIDDAIVVLENIVRFIEERKQKPFIASILASRDIGLAVLATTLSLIAVFLPVAFMGGIVGRFLNSFGLTMSFAIFVSLIVSFSLTPMLAARWLDPPASKGAHGHSKGRLNRLVDAFYQPIESVYMVMLRWSMAHRWVVMVLCGVALASCVPLFQAVPKGFLPPNDEANFEINVRAPEGTSLKETRLIAARIARQTRAIDGVTYTMTTIGDNAQQTPNLANIYVKLTDPKGRTVSQADLVQRVRSEVAAKQPDNLRIDVSDVAAFNSGNSSKSIQYVLNGPNLKTLSDVSNHVVAALKKVPGAVDVDTNLVLGKPEVGLSILRERAQELGVQVLDIANAVQLSVGGLKVGTYEEGGEDYDVRVRLAEAFREQPEQVGLLTVLTSRGTPVTLAELTHAESEAGPSEINRLRRRRAVTLTANVAPGFSEAGIQSALEELVAKEQLPSAYQAAPSGRAKELKRAGIGFLTAFGLSFIFMYLILAAQFESWVHPLTILVSLPLTLPFALLSLFLLGQGLNIQSALGLLVLFGVVKKNAILQVDHTNHLRSEGHDRLEAILMANKDRLRPILMTTVAFVAGMLPLVTARGIGAGFNQATAGIVVGGQTFSLLLTLLAVPVIYALLDDAQGLWRRLVRRGAPVDRGHEDLLAHDAKQASHDII